MTQPPMAPADGAPEFDQAVLKAFLDARLGAADTMRLERIGGGQSNPTFFLDHGARRMVLRKKPAGEILKGAHAIEREYRVLQALFPTDVPVPEPILIHEDPDLIGTPFYLMARVDGRVFSDCALPGLEPAERQAIYMAMARTMARMHALDPEAVGLGDFGRPGNYFARQVSRWTRQLDGSSQAKSPEFERLADWLADNMPADDGRASLAHGDYRLGNLLFHETEPRVVAILDWELSTIGHPLADLGFCCIPWVTSPDEYGGLLGLDIAALGIPSLDAFVAGYMDEAGDMPPLEPFHVAFALFRFAVIFVGIADRALAGTAAGANAAALAPLAQRFAVRALEVIGQDGGPVLSRRGG
ncbi:aminoglycoside phosphotransferase (APT) family kinase protein [Amorphus suaedae]